MPDKLKIAIADMSKANWTGGGQYMKDLLYALRNLGRDGEVEAWILRGAQCHAEVAEKLAHRVIRVDQHINNLQGLPARLRRSLAARGLLPPQPSPYGKLLRRLGAHCLFAASDYGPRLGLPLVAWIPDFQHRHLPQMFSASELRQRDQMFTRMISHAQRVVLSSRQALQDLESFSSQGAEKGRVVNFVAHLPPGLREADPAWVCQRYHLPRRFIYLPNQFWAHKNHSLVLEALERLAKSRPEITVVCTGNTNDSRNPLFFGQLLADVSARGLRERFIILGLVEHDHVFHLMRQCLAVLQPSLFEGWSTTVEEVKSLGKGIVISDIPVHREQDPPRARFFDPRDAGDLARRLEEVYDTCSPGPDRELEEKAAALLPERSRAFARKFLAVIREVVD